jgi:hypothetical protein
MAINKNHEFEELDGIKCAIVERKATAERVAFLKDLLIFNRFTVVVAATPAPKAPVTPQKEGEEAIPAVSIVPETFTIGVTDVSFNPTNAIFGRLLHTRDGHVVTMAYWQQKEATSHDEVPYYEYG